MLHLLVLHVNDIIGSEINMQYDIVEQNLEVKL